MTYEESSPIGDVGFVIDREWHPSALRVSLDVPDRRNALGASSALALERRIVEAEGSEAVRCVVIRGTREAFSGGADLNELHGGTEWEAMRLVNAWTRLTVTVRTALIPIITVVEGPCVGGGYHLNLMADYSVASTDAWFRHTGVDVGIAPMMTGTLMLPLVVGQKRASRLVIWPEQIDASAALQLGICSEIADPGEPVWEAVRRKVDELADRDRVTVALAKSEMNTALGSVLAGSKLSQVAGYLHTVNSR